MRNNVGGGFRKFFVYSGFVMGTILITLGGYLLISPPSDLNKTTAYPEVFGVIAVVYGILRLWRSWVGYKQMQQTEPDNPE